MLRHYLLLSLKVVARRKFFTFISIFGISFTLLVLMLVTALADHAFAPMAPETRQALTLEANGALLYNDSGRGQWCCAASYEFFDTFARNLPGVVTLSIYSDTFDGVSYLEGRKIRSVMKRTDGEFWNILSFSFLEGRPYTAQEVSQAAAVAVINATTRQRFFDGRPAEGKTLVVNGDRYRIVGVVEDVSIVRDVPTSDVWVPHSTAPPPPSGSPSAGMVLHRSEGRTLMARAVGYRAIALAASREAFPQIQREFRSRVSRIDPREYEEGRDGSLTRVSSAFNTKLEGVARNFPPFTDPRSPDPQVWRFMLFVGMLALLFVLLPTVNLVNINVSRIMERASEIGVRKAFGASSRILVGQFVVENLILTLAGGLVGFLLSVVVLRAVTVSGLIPYTRLGVNWRVFAYGLVMAVVFGVVSGVYPAWRMSRLQAVDALRGGRR